ncbi:MAG: transposase [Nannocystaceae bacterium]
MCNFGWEEHETVEYVPARFVVHVERRFYEAVEYIRKVYEVEARAKKLGLDAGGRLVPRQEASLPLLAAFFEWVVEMKPKLGKTSKLAQAVRYALRPQPTAQCRALFHGRPLRDRELRD